MSKPVTCDFCGYESPKASMLQPGEYVEIKPGHEKAVLQLQMRVEPGVKMGSFSVQVVSYAVCTECIFKFLREKEGF